MATTLDRETGELTPVEEERGDFADARLNPKFVQLRQGRQFVSYPGLLDLLHQVSEGFFAVDTEIVQLPTQENGMVAVCVARVRLFDPENADVVRRETTGIGDASPENVARGMHLHLIRLAETRAKARALRDAVNVGMAALEELGPEESAQLGPEESAQQAPPQGPLARTVTVHPEGAAQPEGITIEGTRYTRPQIEAAFRRRLDEAELAGLVAADVETLHVEQTPLPVLVGLMMDWKKRLEAKGGSAPSAEVR